MLLEAPNVILMQNSGITTDPSGASVYFDRKTVGKSPIKFKDVPVRSYKVQIIKEGYEVLEQDVPIKAGEIKRLNVQLKPREPKLGDAWQGTAPPSVPHLMKEHAQTEPEAKKVDSTPPPQIEKKKKQLSFWRWFLWWRIDPTELEEQIAGYDSLEVTQSARGQSFLFLIFSACVTTIFILYFNLESITFVAAIIGLLLGYLIYRGQQWAMITAMILWSLEKLLQIYEALQHSSASGLSSSKLGLHLVWWALYMHAFYLAFKVEGVRTQKRNEHQGT
jgi:hypothetical protein